jgi:hypothetical protein
MGGVLIKLGQFLSIRVDILPSEVTLQLAGLQDKVPAAPTDAIIKQIETDFGRPLSEIFADFSDEPLGAASLAQVHQVVLPPEILRSLKCFAPKFIFWWKQILLLSARLPAGSNYIKKLGSEWIWTG